MDMARLVAWSAGFSPNQLQRVLLSAGAKSDWANRMNAAYSRFSGGMPIDDVVADIEFRGHAFRSDRRACLIRQYTSVFVSRITEFARHIKHPSVLEVGCGAGHLIVSIALELGEGTFVATDVSPDAIELATENSLKNSAQVAFHVSDLFDKVPRQSYDVILANLPLEHVDAGLDPAGVGEHFEPEIAVFDTSGENLGLLRRFLDGVDQYLKPYGRLVLELPEQILALPNIPGNRICDEVGESLGVELNAEDISGLRAALGVCQ